MNVFKKIILSTCIAFLATHFSWSQSIVGGAFTCTGSGTQTLSVSPTTGITSYSWKNTVTNTVVGTTSSVNLPSGSYSVTIVKNGVTSTLPSATTSFTIAAGIIPTAPTVSPSTVSSTICGSNTQTLTASTSANYSWSRNGVALSPAITTNTLSVAGNSVSTAGTYNFTVTTINTTTNCTATSSPVAISLLPKPTTPNITISPSLGKTIADPICGTDAWTLSTTNIVGATYTWKRGGVVISGSTNTITVTGTDVTVGGNYDYTVSVQTSSGCVSDDSSPVTLKVSPKPTTPTITPAVFSPNIVCGTDSKILTATSGGAKYNWKRNNVLVSSSTTINSLTVTGTDVSVGGTYSYTVSYDNSVGCSSDYSTSPVTLQLFPNIPSKPIITANGATTFCEGGSVNLSSNYNANKNIWSRSGGDTTTVGTDVITVRSTNTFTVKALDANGCVSLSSTPLTVTVNLKPAPPIIDKGTAYRICELDSAVLSSNNKGNGVYSWSNGKNSQSITVYGAGSFSLTYTDTQTPACTSLPSLVTVVSVDPLPAKPTIAVLRPLEFCFRDFTTLKASTTTSGATFEWDFNNYKDAQIDVALTTRSTKTEFIKVSVKSVSTFPNNTKACKSKDASDVITVTVNPLPTTPTITASGSVTFCPDSTVSLTSSDSPIGVYKWINTKDNSEFSNKKTVLIDTTSKYFNTSTGGKVGKFYVRTISDKNCVSDTSKNVIITVREAPVAATILANPASGSVCKGESVSLKTLVANGNIAKYYWRDDKTQKELVVPITQNSIKIDTSGAFSVKVRDIYGCFAPYSKPLNVVINPLPTKPSISVVNSKIFCQDDSTIVQSSFPNTTPNGTKNLYRWIVDGQTIIESTSNKFSWKKASSIAVAVTDTNGCKSTAISDTIKTTVNPLPASPTITVRGAIPFCEGKSVLLSAVGTNNVTFKWSTGATTPSTTIYTAGNVTVQSINGFGCFSKPSLPIDVRVNKLPTTPIVTANGATAFCDGSRVRLVSSSPFRAFWFRSLKSTVDSLGNGDDLSSIFAIKTGHYFAKVQDDNGCISLSSASVSVDVRANPTPTIIKQVGTFSLDAQGVGDEEGYIWRYNGDLQADLKTRIIKAKKDGDYQVQASNTYTDVPLAGGKLVCYSKTSDVLKYVRDLSFDGMSVYPNPSADGIINVEVIEDLIGANITIYDLYGRLIFDYKVDKFTTIKKIQLPDYHGDTFVVRVTTDGFEKTRKVITLR